MTPLPEARASAQSFLDEYTRLRAASGVRVLELVARRWADRSDADRRNLAQVLLAVLEPLNEPGAEVTDELRFACEQAVADWIGKTLPTADLSPVPNGPAPAKASRVRLIGAEGGKTPDGHWAARITLEMAGERHAVINPCGSDTPGQLKGGAVGALAALRKAVPDAPPLEIKDVSTFEAFNAVGVIVALLVTEMGRQGTLVGVCPSMGDNPIRAGAVAVLNATNRRLGTG